MNDILKLIREKINYSYAIFILLGVFMFIFPGTTLTLVSIVIGILLIIKGISNISGNKNGSGHGVLYIILGAVFIINTRFISGIIPTLLGILLLINGSNNVSKMKVAKNANIKGSKIEYILAWISVGLGLFMILCPFRTAKFITVLIAICLIYIGVSDIFFGKTEMKMRAEISDADDECTPVDE